MWHFAFLFHGVAYGMLPTLSLLFFVEYLHGPLFDFGVTFAVATLVSIVTSICAGKLPERAGKVKPFIVGSFLCSSVALLACSQVRDVASFQVLFILLEASNSIHIPATRIFVAETYPRAAWSKMYARYHLIVGIAGTAGLAICSAFVSSVGYPTLLLTCAILVFASFLVACIVIEDPPFYIERWLNRVSRPIEDVEGLSYWLGSGGRTGRFTLTPTVNTPLPIFFTNVIHLAPSQTFAVFMVRSLFGAFSYVIVEKWLSERRDGDAVKLASFTRVLLVLLLIPLAVLPLVPIMASVVLSVVAFSWSLYAVDRSTIIMAYASDGSAGIHGALRRGGSMVGGILSGLIPSLFGFNLLFILASTLFGVAFVMFWRSMT
jgi:MFS family permease